MATSSLPALPNATLSKILGEPDAPSIAKLKREVYANARAVPSLSGGGAHGHLGAVTAPQEYATLSNQNEPFVIPVQPAILGPANGLTGPQILERNRQYTDNLRNWDIYTQLMAILKQQIIAAVDPSYLAELDDRYVGFANCQPIDLLDHLTDNHGEASSANLEANRSTISEARNPDIPIATFWDKIHKARIIADEAGEPISDNTTMTLTLQALQQAGVYGNVIAQWTTKDKATKTWPNFKKHFTAWEKLCLEQLKTARQAGYHQANLGTLYTNTGMPVDITNLTNPTPAPTSPGPTTTANNSNTICHHCKKATANTTADSTLVVAYCWTHGLTRAGSNHTSATCQNPAPNHISTATIRNPQGGSQSIYYLNQTAFRSSCRCE